MGAVAPLSPWTAKDDFLFTNAVQAGASLESLAKGAVEFSRKFTIMELEDRWSSILFNVGASTEASKQIIEFKLSEAIRTSKSKRAGNSKSKENDCGDGKRKIESIHRRYYALRKNMCSESLNLGNLSLQGDSYNINGTEVPSVNNIPQDPLANHFGLQDTSFNDSHVFPLENSMAMDPSEELPEGHILNSPVLDCTSSFDHLQYTFTPPEISDLKMIGISEQGIPGDVNITGNNVLTGEQLNIPYDVGYDKGISEYNFSYMEYNQMLCEDIDMKKSTNGTDGYFLELADTPFDFNDLRSLLLDSPLTDTKEVAVPEDKNSAGDGNLCEMHECKSEKQAPTLPPKYGENVKTVCTYNAEDPVIPCNDHVVFPKASSLRITKRMANIQARPCKDDNRNKVPKKGDCRVERKPNQFETSKDELMNHCENPTITNEVPCHRGVGYKPCHVSNSGHLQSGSSELSKEGREMLSVSDQECPMLLDRSEGRFFDSDSDIPYFSDVEAMILDEDLVPDDQDSFSAAKYLHEGMEKELIKLEQRAHSRMKRDFAFHGAFAILYDRHWKHYIKKPEVLLGRGTYDVPVDIKVGEEHCAKISRREAIIKMDTDGAFYLKNLGKHLIYVNEKEIRPGQFLRLLSNCHIEIRGMSFIFETDEKSVTKYLSNSAGKDDTKADLVL